MTHTKPPAKAWLIAAAMLLGLSACNASESKTAVPDPYANVSPKEPIAIPFPLDKAGFTVDTTFWVVPGVPKGRSSNHFVGLHMFFTPGDPDGRNKLMAENPTAVRVTLHRLENGVETKVAIRHAINIQPDRYKPSKFVAENLPGDVGESTSEFSQSSTTSKLSDSALHVYSFGGMTLTPGQYRLRTTTLKDLPSLKGIPAQLVVEHDYLSK